MSSLKHVEQILLEDLLGMASGYVLDFSDWTYEQFFKENGIDIEHEKYHFNGRSKARRMRAFWEIGTDEEVGRVLSGLFEYIEKLRPENCGGDVLDDHLQIAQRLLRTTESLTSNRDEFLESEFDIDLKSLHLDSRLESSIEQRLNEIKICVAQGASLAAIFLSGSTLEGLLLASATNEPERFNRARSAPTEDGKVKPFHQWSLNNLIDTANEVGMIGLDVKKYSHVLREFRNYIHPYQQAASNFHPDDDTAKISWQVLKAAISDLSNS